MCHIYGKGIQRIPISAGADILTEINIIGSSQNQFRVVSWGTDMNACTGFTVDPLSGTALGIPGKYQDMARGTLGIHQKTQVTGKQLRLTNGTGMGVLSPGTCLNAYAKCCLIYPVGKTGAIQAKRPNGACTGRTCRGNQFGFVPFIIPACFTFAAPEIGHLANQG